MQVVGYFPLARDEGGQEVMEVKGTPIVPTGATEQPAVFVVGVFGTVVEGRAGMGFDPAEPAAVKQLGPGPLRPNFNRAQSSCNGPTEPVAAACYGAELKRQAASRHPSLCPVRPLIEGLRRYPQGDGRCRVAWEEGVIEDAGDACGPLRQPGFIQRPCVQVAGDRTYTGSEGGGGLAGTGVDGAANCDGDGFIHHRNSKQLPQPFHSLG